MTDNKTPAQLSTVFDFYSAVDKGNISGARRLTMASLEHADNIRAWTKQWCIRIVTIVVYDYG